MSEQNADFEDLLQYLKGTRAFDFTGYKRASLERRISKRMTDAQVETFRDYQDYLEVHPDEFSHLFDTILINVTAFFRDPAAWDAVAESAIPAIDRARDGSGQIRVWTTGCASGEEAYTAAMIFAEALGEDVFEQRVKVYATDADEDALAAARHGVYTAKDLQSVPDELRSKYFEQVGDRFAFKKKLRRNVIFGRHDLVQDAPISKLDLLICRNTLMYFNADLQGRIVRNFHFALNEHGFLFLGKAETLMTHGELFAPADLKHRLFSKVTGGTRRDTVFGLPAHAVTDPLTVRAIQLRDAAIDAGPVAEILVDADGTLLLANQQARALFDVSANDLGRPVQDLELSYRPLELRSRIETAYTERRPIRVNNVDRPSGNGEIQTFDITVTPIADPSGEALGVAVAFADVTRNRRLRQDLERTNQELETAYEELQSTNEELETTNEELQSTVEELETTNEELQSANEELETTNEELQSTNAEVQAVNDEMSVRSDELNRLMAIAEGIVSTLDMGIIVIDDEMKVRSWNERAADLWGISSKEVDGVPFFELDINLPTAKLREAIEGCLQGTAGELSLDVSDRRGRPMSYTISCRPLRDRDGVLRGVVVAMDESETS